MPGLSKCYIDIISSQLSREQIQQYCEYLRPTKSLRRLATLCRAALQLSSKTHRGRYCKSRAQIHTNPNDGPELGVR